MQCITNIVSNSELYEQTIDSFFTNLQPQIELAFETYAKQFNKDLETITDEEIAFVIDKFVDLFLDHMMESLMKSQGVPKIIKTARQIPAAEHNYPYLFRVVFQPSGSEISLAVRIRYYFNRHL